MHSVYSEQQESETQGCRGLFLCSILRQHVVAFLNSENIAPVM